MLLIELAVLAVTIFAALGTDAMAFINAGGIQDSLPSSYLPADTSLRRPDEGYAQGPPYDVVWTDVERAIHDLRIDPGGERARATLCFPGELEVFAGHFPDMPLVPGILIIEATRALAERCLDRSLGIVEVIDAKFLDEVQPDQVIECEIEVSPNDSGWRGDARFSSESTKVARVRLQLGAD